MVLAGATSAYTLVMRSGRRVEIPSRFTVSGAMLTYEAAPGIQVTLQIASINIPATERANREAPGSFLSHAESTPAISQPAVAKARQRTTIRTVTNRDLESYAQTRRLTERAYEKRRVELGLPSIADSRKKADAEAAAIDEELAQHRQEQQGLESYWRARATSLRTEMMAVDAEMASLGNRLDEVRFTSSSSLPAFTSVYPLAPFGHSLRRGRYPSARSAVFSTLAGGIQPGRLSFGRDAYRSQTIFNNGGFLNASPFYSPFAYPTTGFSPSFPQYDSSYEQTLLITRLNELRANREGLAARWRALEDEARRAGAPPGWLRD